MQNSFRNIVKIFFAVLVFGAVFFFGITRQTNVANALDCAPDDRECQIAKQREEAEQAKVVQEACNGRPECVQEAKDIFNAESVKQTQSIQTLANAEASKSFCGGLLNLDVSCYLVQFLDWASSGLLRIPLVLVAGFLDQAVTLALTLPMDQIGFVVQGWKIIRDVSNMFYVLILLWVALGTIFDFPKYNIREILPKLVISALLINFSLPLGTLVINTTNALANVFYQGIVDAGTGINGEGKGRLLADKILENSDIVVIVNNSIQANLGQKGENIQQTITKGGEGLKNTQMKDSNGQTITVDCSKINGDKIITDVITQRHAQYAISPIDKTIIEGGAAAGCKDAVTNYLNTVEKVQDPMLLPFARLTAIIWKLILVPVLIFVLFAAALFVFIRTISLAFLLIFGPFVFLAWALPETRQYWTQWWDKLLKWSFFMPVLMFMLFLSVTMMTTFTPHMGLTAGTQNVLGNTGNEPTLFVANMHFLFILMLLIGSLTVADKMGIEMATQVRGLGQKALGGIKRQAKKPGRIARLNLQTQLGRATKGITESEAFTKLVNLPIIGTLGGRYAARTLAQMERAGETAAATRLKEKYGGDVTRMRPEQQAALFATASASEAKTFFNRLEPEDRQKAYEKMNAAQRSAFEQKLRASGINDSDIGIMSKDPALVAEGTNPALRTLKETDPERYKDAVIETLRSGGFNFKNANPEFINSETGIRLLRTITEAEVKQVRATKEGAKAFAAALSKVDTTPKVITEMKEVVTATGREMREVKTTVPPESLSEYLRDIIGKGPFRAMLAGTKLSSDTPEYERIEKMLKRMEGKMENSDQGGKTSSPPSGHIPGAI